MKHALLALFIACLSTLCSAQQVDGNAHPEQHAVSDHAGEVVNPFGAPSRVPTMDTAEKAAFADALDLSALEDIAVFHNGRVKIIGTLAEETTTNLTGRHKHFDLLRTTEGDKEKVEKITFDPMFTLFDTMIDPVHYLDRPLLGINYLPLRRAMLERAFPDDYEKQAAWLKTGMISPRMADSFTSEVFAAHDESEPFRKAVGRLDRSFGVFRNGLANLLVVAPDEKDDEWIHLGALPDSAPSRIAAHKLADAWRAGDAEAVESAASELASALEAIHPETYPSTRRSVEAFYNKANAFEWGLWIYLLSLVLLILAFGTGRKWLISAGVGALIVAIAFHALGFTLRSFIAERFAIQNQFESMTGLSLFAAVVGTIIMLWRKQWLFGAAAAGTGFLVLITATQTGIPGEAIGREAAILNTSVLLKYHVTTVLTSYGLITLGFICSLFYLGTHYAGKFFATTKVATVGGESVAAGALGLDDDDGNTGRARTLKDLDTATMTILQLAFWTLGVGTLLGAWWADHSWGRWWAFDPKETWALVTWIVYLIVIHVRFMQLKDRGLTTAWLSVIGFFVMLWTYFGVNLLLPGLHAYA